MFRYFKQGNMDASINLTKTPDLNTVKQKLLKVCLFCIRISLLVEWGKFIRSGEIQVLKIQLTKQWFRLYHAHFFILAWQLLPWC